METPQFQAYSKGISIIESCINETQLKAAGKYIQLFKKHHVIGQSDKTYSSLLYRSLDYKHGLKKHNLRINN